MGTVGLLCNVGDFRFYYSCGNIWPPQYWQSPTCANTQTNTFTNQHCGKAFHLPQY